MNYFVLEATKTKGSEAIAKKLSVVDNERIATMNYHQVMASALANENVEYALCMVINEEGYALITGKFPTTEEPEI